MTKPNASARFQELLYAENHLTECLLPEIQDYLGGLFAEMWKDTCTRNPSAEPKKRQLLFREDLAYIHHWSARQRKDAITAFTRKAPAMGADAPALIQLKYQLVHIGVTGALDDAAAISGPAQTEHRHKVKESVERLPWTLITACADKFFVNPSWFDQDQSDAAQTYYNFLLIRETIADCFIRELARCTPRLPTGLTSIVSPRSAPPKRAAAPLTRPADPPAITATKHPTHDTTTEDPPLALTEENIKAHNDRINNLAITAKRAPPPLPVTPAQTPITPITTSHPGSATAQQNGTPHVATMMPALSRISPARKPPQRAPPAPTPAVQLPDDISEMTNSPISLATPQIPTRHPDPFFRRNRPTPLVKRRARSINREANFVLVDE